MTFRVRPANPAQKLGTILFRLTPGRLIGLMIGADHDNVRNRMIIANILPVMRQAAPVADLSLTL
jgi:hypothetical protein